MRERFLKRIITYLCCTKCKEITICYKDVENHVSYVGSHRFLIYNELYLVMAEKVFSVDFHSFSFIPNCNAYCETHVI